MDSKNAGPQDCVLRGSLVWLIVAGILVVRIAILLTPSALQTDPDGYRALAENLVEHGTFGRGDVPTAYRPPLYPLALAPAVALGSWSRATIAVLHLALGLGTVAIVFRLGRLWGLGKYAILAAVLVAIDPILLAQSALVMTETVAAFLAVLCIWLLTGAAMRPSPWRSALAGGCLGLAVLCRPTFLPWAGLAAILLLWFARRHEKPDGWVRQAVRIAAPLLACVAVVLAPWGVRNQIEFGRPIVSTTHGGYTLLLGNNPDFYEYLRSGDWGSVWWSDKLDQELSSQIFQSSTADELAADRVAYDLAYRNIRSEPGLFAYACLIRVGRLWSPLPHQTSPTESFARRLLRYAVGLWYLVVLPLAAIGLIVGISLPRSLDTPSARRRVGLVWGLLLAAVFTAVHTLYWADLRMRAPLMPAVALAAACGTAWLADRWLRRK